MADVNQQKENNAPQEDVGQLLKVRRQKLADLQEAGRDPFVITKFDQTHHTDEVLSLYEEHEKEILKDYEEAVLEEPAEGADNETISAYRQAKKEAYNKRRELLDASPINVSIAGRMLFKRVMGISALSSTRSSSHFVACSLISYRPSPSRLPST